MAGCYGNHPFDRYWEARLDDYLDSQEGDEIKFEDCEDLEVDDVEYT